MKEETEAKLYELLNYITNTLKYYSEKDYEYHKVCLSLTRHSARDIITLIEKELESEEE
tara:strand:+ start:879 stop:1055 length:177 start_codon:yes stop_codon:yes gene_type:complete